jgi:uncharacterized protein (TIRG00374 family)
MVSHRACRRTLATVLVVGAVAFAARNGPTVVPAVRELRTAARAPVLAGIVLTGIAIMNRAASNRAAHLGVGLDVPRWSMLRPTTAGFAADRIFRSGGVSGVTLLVRHGARRGYPRGSVLAACLLERAASVAALGLVMVASTLAVLLSGQLTTWWLAAATGFAVYTVAGGAIVIVLSRRRALATRIWTELARRAPRLAAALGRDPLGELTSALGASSGNRPDLARVVAHAVAAKALGAAMLFAAALAVHVPIGPTVALAAYATALLASMASITPGGLGAVEASTTALLVAAGAGVDRAAVAVALFRIFDLWIPVLAGALAAWETPWNSKAEHREPSAGLQSTPPMAVTAQQPELVVP